MFYFPLISPYFHGEEHVENPYEQGNRLTRRPCKGDEFEIVIFEGKRENAGTCRSRQKMCTTWTFISIGRRVTQEWKIEFRLRGDLIFLQLVNAGWGFIWGFVTTQHT